MGEPVILDGGEIDACQRLHHLLRLRALHGEQRVARARVDGNRVARRRDLLGNPRVVRLDVAGVHDEQEMIRREPVHEQIVDESAVRRRQPRVLRLADGELRRVVRRDALDGGERVLPGDLDLAHVADVEDARAGAHGEMLVHDARVFDRHVPPAERHHLRAGSTMSGVERRLFERCGGCLLHRENGARGASGNR